MENLRFLQKILKESGIEEKLKTMGVVNGSEVYVEGVVFKYYE